MEPQQLGTQHTIIIWLKLSYKNSPNYVTTFKELYNNLFYKFLNIEIIKNVVLITTAQKFLYITKKKKIRQRKFDQYKQKNFKVQNM